MGCDVDPDEISAIKPYNDEAIQQFEDHRERRPVGQAALRSDRAVAHVSEGCVYRKLKPGRIDGEVRRVSGVNE